MTRESRNPIVRRAAAAAVLAILLTACGKNVTVTGGGGEAALSDEERLYVDAAALLRSLLPRWVRERARYQPTAAERAGPNAAFTDLVSVAERHAIDPADVNAAAGFAPSFAQRVAGYTRSAPYPPIRPDDGALWQERADDSGTPAQKSLVRYWAPSGVSQSSRGGSATHDRAHADVPWSHDRTHVQVGWSGGGPTYRVGIRHAGDPGYPGSLTHWSVDSESSNRAADYFTRWTGPDGARGGAFRAGIPGGNLKLFVRTDRTGAADTDWLATGIWWSQTTSAPHESFGVFADGGDVVNDQMRLWQLAGTATYAGVAHGVFSHYAAAEGNEGDENHVLFQGSASLTADFGAARAVDHMDDAIVGTVSGSIYNMKSGSAPGAAHYVPGLPTITLGDASVDPTGYRRGSFRGATSMTYNGATYSGRWGGQFFGNPAAGATGADAHPSSAAGTFGVTAGEGSSFVGTFEVKR